jgi:glyoxylase-like metal-dependent hydrolase (beta-lactamase superfamily II)
MKKYYISINALFILSLINISVFSQQQEGTPVRLEIISERLYEILDGRGSRGGAYIGDNGVLLIDAKMDKNSVDETIEEIKKITDKPIKYLVNTHSDGDHINGNRYFPESTFFIAHNNCRKEFFHPKRDGSPSEWTSLELAPFVPSITFSDNLNIFLGSKKVELWYFGVGHTTGDAVVYFPDEKTAFLGDQIFKDRPQLIHAYKGGNSFEYVKTLTRLLDTLEAEKYCSGHSDILGREDILEHLIDMKNRQQKVRSLIEEKMTLEEIKSEFEEDEGWLIETIFNEIINS